MKGLPADIAAWIRTRAALVSDRLGRTTARERLLLGGLVLGALAYAPIAALEWRTSQEDAYVAALTERSAARLEQTSARRISAAAASAAALRDMQDWGFRATNSAVAGVLIERRLVEATTDAGLTRVKITMDSDIEDEGATTWLGAQVEADLLWRGLFEMLDTLAGWPEGFRVTRFNYEVRPIPPGMEGVPGISSGTLRLGLSFPVAVETRDDGKGASQGATPPQAARAAVSNEMFDAGPRR